MRQLGLRSARDLRLFLLRRSVGRSARLVVDIGVNFLAAMACSATFRGLLLLDERTMPDVLRAALCGLSAFGTGWFLTTVRLLDDIGAACSQAALLSQAAGGW